MKIKAQTLLIGVLISALSIALGRYVFPVIPQENGTPFIGVSSSTSPSPESLIKTLYDNFNPMNNRSIINANKEVLATYFTDNLANLIINERAYHTKTGFIDCGPGYEPLSASQDPDIQSIEVGQFDTTHNQVAVNLIGRPKMQLIYTFENTPHGWRISDILFPDGQIFTDSLETCL